MIPDAIVATVVVLKFLGSGLLESERGKDDRFLTLLVQNKCPQNEEEWKGVTGALTRVQDNQFTEDLVRVFKKCVSKK